MDNPGCGLNVSALREERNSHQFSIHLIDQAIIAPSVKIAAYGKNR